MTKNMEEIILQELFKLSSKIDDLDKKTDERFKKQDEKFTLKFNELEGQISEIKTNMATKKELQDLDYKFTSKFNEIEQTMATKQELKEQIDEVKATMVTKQELKEQIDEVKETMATKQELKEQTKRIEKLEKRMDETIQEVSIMFQDAFNTTTKYQKQMEKRILDKIDKITEYNQAPIRYPNAF